MLDAGSRAGCRGTGSSSAFELVEVAGRQVLEADVEALVRVPVARADRPHVRLDGHQQHRVEALGPPVGRIDPHLVGGRPPGQRPCGVGDQQRGRAVGVHQAAATGRHPPEPVAEERVGLVLADGPRTPNSPGPRPASSGPAPGGAKRTSAQVSPPSQNVGRRSTRPLSCSNSTHYLGGGQRAVRSHARRTEMDMTLPWVARCR